MIGDNMAFPSWPDRLTLANNDPIAFLYELMTLTHEELRHLACTVDLLIEVPIDAQPVMQAIFTQALIARESKARAEIEASISLARPEVFTATSLHLAGRLIFAAEWAASLREADPLVDVLKTDARLFDALGILYAAALINRGRVISEGNSMDFPS